jgi:RNA polymerase sigma-70 factor (ECF subfamily)
MNQARSRAIDRLRYEQRKKRVNNEAGHIRDEKEGENPHNAFNSDEQSRLLRTALDVLNPEERQAVEMTYFSELTYREAAVRLNQPLGTIKSRIRSGLSKLRRALAPKSGDV